MNENGGLIVSADDDVVLPPNKLPSPFPLIGVLNLKLLFPKNIPLVFDVVLPAAAVAAAIAAPKLNSKFFSEE